MPTDTAVSQSALPCACVRACTISSGGCQDAKKDFMRSPDSCEEEQLLGGIEPRLSSTCNVCSLTLMSYVIVKLRTRRFYADLLARWQLQKHGRRGGGGGRLRWRRVRCLSAHFHVLRVLPNPDPVARRARQGAAPSTLYRIMGPVTTAREYERRRWMRRRRRPRGL